MTGAVTDGEKPSYSDRTAAIKIDTIDEQALQYIENNYIQNATEHMQMVRPWINRDYVQKACIDPISQFALYKCMHEKCVFATDSMENWFIHMKIHLQYIDYLKNHDRLTKLNRSQHVKFRECPYCSYAARANHEVIRHMEEEHRRSIFQCSLCFYRTIEMDNMALHMKLCHSGHSQVYLCGDVCEFEQQDEDVLEQDIEVNVAKIRCAQGKCEITERTAFVQCINICAILCVE